MLKKVQLGISLLILLLTCTGCGALYPQMTTKAEAFPLMYESPPLSVLILPPINESTAAEAKDYYSTTIHEPFVMSGYYVFPYELSNEILKLEGFSDAALIKDAPLEKFREFFGADAVLFTTIKHWDLTYVVLNASLLVSIDCELKSTDLGATLWKYNGSVRVDLSGSNNQGDLAGLIAQAIVTSINSAAADYVPYARLANYKAIASLPSGKYNPRYLLDQQDKLIKQD